MTRNIHDSFAKEWMKELLGDFGEVKVEREIAGEVRTIDIVFFPDPELRSNLIGLGLMGKILDSPCGVEAFRNAVPAWEITNCRVKLFELIQELRRQAKQKKQQLKTIDHPFLWILTPTFSDRLQQEFCVVQKPGWGAGIYFLPRHDRTAIVAVHHLPTTLDTLWLRLFGKGEVQRGAMVELLALPPTHPYRQETLKHLTILQINFKARQNKTKEIRETMMSLSVVYEQWEKERLDQGRDEGQQIGQQQERRSMALKMLQAGAMVDFVVQVTGYTAEEVRSLQVQVGGKLSSGPQQAP